MLNRGWQGCSRTAAPPNSPSQSILLVHIFQVMNAGKAKTLPVCDCGKRVWRCALCCIDFFCAAGQIMDFFIVKKRRLAVTLLYF
mmetsp:Transcript_13880/g.22054  ORF Transcript_13880/g.22054 Transcript_13880/m.22054 type:complete len:85 (-) Transcript_13880:396-650(-)